MSLSVSKDPDNLPSDAVRLSKPQALKYQWLLVRKWEPSSET
jgi:hypothetical protein